MAKTQKTAPKPKPAKVIEPPRERERGELTYIGCEIDEDLGLAVQMYRKEHGPTKRFIVEKALKMFLESKGFWPPPK